MGQRFQKKKITWETEYCSFRKPIQNSILGDGGGDTISFNNYS